MAISEDWLLPAALVEVATVEFDYDDGNGIDYEPFAEFKPAEENRFWWPLWTGKPDLDGAEFRVFGMDGTGGYSAFWLVRNGQPLTSQPIVFLGSEGEVGVVARDLADFLWLLADGFGPLEAVEYPERPARPQRELTEIAERYAADRRASAATVIAAARTEFPDFERTIMELCR